MLKNKFRSYPIAKKITHVYLPLSIIPLIIIAIIFSNTYKKRVEESSFKNVMDNSSLIISRIQEILKAANDCSNMIIINLNTVIDQHNSKEYFSEFQRDLDINRQLYNANLIFSQVDSIVFIDTNKKAYSTDYRLLNTPSQGFYQDKIKEIFKSNKEQNAWISTHQSSGEINAANENILTMAKKVIHIKTGKTLGYIFINVAESNFSLMFDDQAIEYILVDENKIISSKDYDKLHSETAYTNISAVIGPTNKSMIKIMNGSKYLLVNIPLGFNQWNLVGSVDLKLLTDDLSKLTMFIVITVFISIIIQIIGAKSLSYLIAHPVNKASEKMKLVGEGNFDVHFDVEGNDEIGLFLHTFNRMAIKIKKLVLQVEEKEKLKREYELALIQHQIKPHFLYNTLNIIYMLCEMNMKKEALNATKALADFYKGILSNGRQIITIEEELSTLEDYLYIQMLKYSDVFEYHFDVDEDVLKHSIMKLTLQPLVENAIYHGLKPNNKFGKLKIQAKMIVEKIEIIIEDDGIGAKEEICNRVNNGNVLRNKDHFGLFNVKDRITLYFGDEASFKITSEEGKGTKVRILLPKQEAEKEVMA